MSAETNPVFSWTQPICEGCFSLRYPTKHGTRLIEPELEYCVDCRHSTRSGLYIRVDPKEARWPTNLKTR